MVLEVPVVAGWPMLLKNSYAFFWSSERTAHQRGWAKLEESIDFWRVCGADKTVDEAFLVSS